MNDQYHEGLIGRLRATANDVAWLFSSIPAELVEQPADVDWSPRDLLAHLRDVEYGIYIHRLHTTALEEDPEFQRFDADNWRVSERYEPQSPDVLLIDFLSGRRTTVGILERLHPEDWHRTAKSAVANPYTVEIIAERAYSHTLDHLVQLIGMRRKLLGPDG